MVERIPVKSSRNTPKETGMVILMSHFVVFHDRGKANRTHFFSLFKKESDILKSFVNSVCFANVANVF
jgi:hypothetical protein